MTDTTPTPNATPTPHRATPEQWDWMAEWDSPLPIPSTILELRARVEALEAQQPAPCPHVRTSDEGTSYCALAEQAEPSQPAPAEDAESGLVWQVAEEISENLGPADLYLPDARVAIRVVARWLREELHGLAADRLEQEAER